MPKKRSALLAALCLAMLEMSLATGCATTEPKRGKEKQERVTRSKMKRTGKGGTKGYSLYQGRDLDWKIIHRGRRARGGAALDSY